ncbi:MAG: hypothetical protein H0V81_15975 [Solirubrobacterales bacterium]|nr:hypothetical protein [Solirubrobacterales bacterium]
MLESALRTFAVVASLLVIAGFGLFVIDEARSATDQTTAEIAGQKATRTADPSPEEERAREAAHSGARELIDDAGDVLLSPVAGLTADSESRWVRRGVPALLALLIYGFGVGMLARFAAR